MSWVEAIKKYAEVNGGKFVIPKRDSEDYAKVKAIQERMAKGEKIEMPKATKTKAEKKANMDAPAPIVEETPKKRKSIPKPEKKANTDDPVAPPVMEEKKVVKRRAPKKEKTANVEPVEEPVVSETPVKVPKVKREKKVNVDIVPEEKDVVEVKAPKKSAKEVRAEKKEVNDKHSEEVARVRGKKALIDARMRMINTPVVLEFN